MVVSLVSIKEKEADELVERFGEEDLLKCIFGLSSTEIEIYGVLSRGDTMTVAEVANAVSKSRSTVERSLIKFVQLGLANRRPVLARNGGYTYVYSVKPPEQVRGRLVELVDAFHERARAIAESFHNIAKGQEPKPRN